MDRLRQFLWLCRKVSRRLSLINHDSIPSSHHLVRVCKAKHIENGEIQPAAFEPHIVEGKTEDYLSVHWMEYLKPDVSKLSEGVGLVRDFLLKHSKFDELKPTKKGKLVVLCAGDLTDFTSEGKTTGFKCQHEPRKKGGPKFGEGDVTTDGFDPHSGIYTMPWKGAELLAVQQYLLSKKIYEEQGKP